MTVLGDLNYPRADKRLAYVFSLSVQALTKVYGSFGSQKRLPSDEACSSSSSTAGSITDMVVILVEACVVAARFLAYEGACAIEI